MMKNEKIVLEAGFSLHQQIILTGFSLPSLLLALGLINMDLNWKGYLAFLISILLFLMFISLAFSKKGLLRKNIKLYKGYFFKGTVLYKKRIKMNDRPVVSILTFKKSQKFAFIAAAKPDYSESFHSFEVFVLNESHYKRDSVIYLKTKENAERTIAFLTAHFPLRHETFSPGR